LGIGSFEIQNQYSVSLAFVFAHFFGLGFSALQIGLGLPA
jgi:hypothetical protein